MQVGLAEMITRMRAAIHPASQAHFGGTIVFEDFAAGSLPNPACQAFRYMIAAQHYGTQALEHPWGKFAAFQCDGEHLDGKPDQQRGFLTVDASERRSW